MEIMAEVLSILGTLTKEIGKGKGMPFPTDNPSKIDLRPGKFVKMIFKKLVAWPGPSAEDLLKGLDNLTLEEARMARAEYLKITHGINDKAKVVQEKLEVVDQNVQTVDRKVEDIDEKAGGAKDKVIGVSGNASAVIEGEVHLLSQPAHYLTLALG